MGDFQGGKASDECYAAGKSVQDQMAIVNDGKIG